MVPISAPGQFLYTLRKSRVITALVALAVIAMFTLDLLCVLGILRCKSTPDPARNDTK
jgi:hypothetical protein